MRESLGVIKQLRRGINSLWGGRKELSEFFQSKMRTYMYLHLIMYVVRVCMGMYNYHIAVAY